MSEVAALAAMFVRATGATRVLEIGSGTGESGLAIAAAQPLDGMLITIERNAEKAATARQAFATAKYGSRVSLVTGDPSRYLHKIAGPFGVILQNGDRAQFAAVHERLISLLARGGTLITHGIGDPASGGYNESLAADTRLSTVTLNLGDGVAISVLRPTTS